MGREIRGVSEAAPLAADLTGAALQADPSGVPEGFAAQDSIGRYLAGQRKLRKISLDELSTLTRIPRRSLERLESGAFDSNPDGFARGFVRTVAEALGLDPDEAVMRLMREPDEEDAGDPGVAAFDTKAWLGRAVLLAGLILATVLGWRLVGAWLEPAEAPAEDDLVWRRDPVRNLVEELRAGAVLPSGKNLEEQER